MVKLPNIGIPGKVFESILDSSTLCLGRGPGIHLREQATVQKRAYEPQKLAKETKQTGAMAQGESTRTKKAVPTVKTR